MRVREISRPIRSRTFGTTRLSLRRGKNKLGEWKREAEERDAGDSVQEPKNLQWKVQRVIKGGEVEGENHPRLLLR